jgi:hypothetical protein
MAAMDDATGKLLVARFFPFEGSSGYLWLLREVVKRYGIPLVMYHDRHGSLHRNDSHWSLEEQLAGRQEPTQVGLALEALGVESNAMKKFETLSIKSEINSNVRSTNDSNE